MGANEHEELQGRQLASASFSIRDFPGSWVVYKKQKTHRREAVG
jgi:hypothetical protein